jgi:hypothetical protein
MSRILFVMLHPGFVRYYDGALRELAAAGHEVHVAFEVNRTKLGEDVTASRLASISPQLTCGSTPERRESVRDFLARGDRQATRSGGAVGWSSASSEETWDSLATTVRLLLDYIRFFDPVFAHASALRARAEKRIPRIYRRVVGVISSGGATARGMVSSLLSGLERLIPSNPAIEAFVREQNPDLVLVTPLIELGSQQVDYVKSARTLGIRSALCVASWDNLTSKGLIRVLPDHVIVWNEAQKREAVQLHGVAPEQVVTTGAQLFDRWFDAAPSRSRAEFCRAVGLDPNRPFVLYVGSSIFIAPEEAPFAEQWLSMVRESTDPALAGLGVLIRPHPANSRQWRAFDTSEFENTAIWPPIGTDPTAADFHRDFFDSLYHSAAVVGINTSAQLEAAIVGRPVLTVSVPEFAHAHQGTLHFKHLVDSRAPLLHVASTLEEHVHQLAAAVRMPHATQTDREFVRWFIRPQGLDEPSTPRFVREVEKIARLPRPAAHGDGIAVRVLRPLAFLLARGARTLAEDRPLWAYPLRTIVDAGVETWAAAFSVREAISRVAGRNLRRGKRRTQQILYEASKSVGKRVRRANKTLVHGPASRVRALASKTHRRG